MEKSSSISKGRSYVFRRTRNLLNYTLLNVKNIVNKEEATKKWFVFLFVSIVQTTVCSETESIVLYTILSVGPWSNGFKRGI